MTDGRKNVAEYFRKRYIHPKSEETLTDPWQRELDSWFTYVREDRDTQIHCNHLGEPVILCMRKNTEDRPSFQGSERCRSFFFVSVFHNDNCQFAFNSPAWVVSESSAEASFEWSLNQILSEWKMPSTRCSTNSHASKAHTLSEQSNKEQARSSKSGLATNAFAQAREPPWNRHS